MPFFFWGGGGAVIHELSIVAVQHLTIFGVFINHCQTSMQLKKA